MSIFHHTQIIKQTFDTAIDLIMNKSIWPKNSVYRGREKTFSWILLKTREVLNKI